MAADDTVAELGERILEELYADRTNDTLTRWLAHHTAGLIEDLNQEPADVGEADVRAAEARSAILQLWQQRSDWPHGWPPPRATEVARLLDSVPALDDPAWQRHGVFARLQDLHHEIVATLVDLAVSHGASTTIEQGWLDNFGDHLTDDELALLRRVTGAEERLQRLKNWLVPLDPDNQDVDQKDKSTTHPLVGLTSLYRQLVLDCLQEIENNHGVD